MRRLAILLVALTFALPASAQRCPGDCNGDLSVTVSELVRSVRTLLGDFAVAGCPNADPNGDGVVAVAELVAAVRASLDGCFGAPSCPLDFTDRATVETACIFRGPWSATCGGEIQVFFSNPGGNSGLVVFVVDTTPLVYIAAELTSPTSATLIGWDTDSTFPRPVPVDGFASLGDGGNRLAILPSFGVAPFTVENCPFSRYIGEYVQR